MFFIKSGTVEVVVDGKVAAILSDGSHFGEICLLTEDRRVADVVAFTTTDTFSLTKDNFNLLLEEYPDMREPLESVALKRLSTIGKMPSPFPSRTGHCRSVRLSTNIPPPPIVVDDSACKESLRPPELETIDISKDVIIEENLRRFASEPIQGRKECVLDPPKSFSDTGKRKLPPLKMRKIIGEPSGCNPNMIQYPVSDTSDEEDQ